MDGVHPAERRDQLQCGIAVFDLRSGQTVAVLEFQTAVNEIFDVQLLAAARFGVAHRITKPWFAVGSFRGPNRTRLFQYR